MYQYFIHLLRSALHGTTPNVPPADLDWEQLYRLADFHSVACTAYYGIILLPEEHQPESKTLALFRKAMQIVLGRESMQHFELQNVMEHMENKGIPYLPLKGWHLKHLYPRPDMRSMCDVDILVPSDAMKKIPELMKECGFLLESHGENHDEYAKAESLTTEIHWLLFGKCSPYYDYFKDFLKRTSPTGEGKQEQKLSNEDFYIHLIAHMAKHFRGGGTGVRSIMDIYEYQQAYGNTLDQAYLDKELDELGLRGFARAAEELAQSWFAEDDANVDRNSHPKMALHILTAGTYGRKDVGVASSISEDNIGKGTYLLRRFFPKLSFMQMQYPILEKVPFFLPVFWVVRGFRSVFLRTDNFKQELLAVRDTDGEDKERMKEIWIDSGLQD